MKRTGFQFLTLIVLIAAMTATAMGRQTAPPQQRPRISAQQPQGGATKTPKQAQQLPRNLTADQPNAPKRNEQQQKNRIANAVVDRYVSGFQSNVGLNNEQTRKFSAVLGRYVRQQLMLAERKNQLRKELKDMTDRQAPEEKIQAQYERVMQAERQLANTEKKFYDDINPQLSAQQKARLKIYLDQTGQDIRQAIQKSTEQ